MPPRLLNSSAKSPHHAVIPCLLRLQPISAIILWKMCLSKQGRSRCSWRRRQTSGACCWSERVTRMLFFACFFHRTTACVCIQAAPSQGSYRPPHLRRTPRTRRLHSSIILIHEKAVYCRLPAEQPVAAPRQRAPRVTTARTSHSRYNHQRGASDASAAVKCAAVFKFCRWQDLSTTLSSATAVASRGSAQPATCRKTSPSPPTPSAQAAPVHARDEARRPRAAGRGAHLQVTTAAKLLHLQCLISTLQGAFSQAACATRPACSISAPPLALTCSPLSNPFADSRACTVK